MKKLLPFVAGVGLLIFGLAVGAIVISLSYRALGLIFPDDLFDQIIGLMLFDAAALIWFTVFVYLCESTMQYVFAFLGFLLGLGGTVGLVSIEVGISSGMLDAADMLKPLTYVFIGVAIGHVILLYARHAAAPHVNSKISLGIDKAKIIDEGQKQAEEHLAKQLPHLGAAISNRLIEEVMRDLNLSGSGGRMIDLPALPVDNATPTPAQGLKIPGVDFVKNWIFNRGKGARKFEQVSQVAQPTPAPLDWEHMDDETWWREVNRVNFEKLAARQGEREVRTPVSQVQNGRGNDSTPPPTQELHYHPMAYEASTQKHEVKREPLSEIFRGEPIFFMSAVATGGGGVEIKIGTPLQAILCEDGKYNLSEPGATYAIARLTEDELNYFRTGKRAEAARKGEDFRAE